jgi:hypothetical protein
MKMTICLLEYLVETTYTGLAENKQTNKQTCKNANGITKHWKNKRKRPNMPLILTAIYIESTRWSLFFRIYIHFSLMHATGSVCLTAPPPPLILVLLIIFDKNYKL